MSYCRECMQARTRKTRPTPAHTAAFRYRLPLEKVQELLAGGCGVCGSHKNLTIDHDHACCPNNGRSCGQCVRGALCHTHNIGLGMLGDNLDGVMRLVRYLEDEA